MIIRQAHKEELEAVREFYLSQGYRGGESMDGSEFTIVAEDDDRIVGAVRLVIEEGVLVLRGMFIDKPYQRQGIGKQMLDLMDIEIGDRECYSICKEYLERFLGEIGFSKMKPEKAPMHLAERFKEYSEGKEYGEMIMVKREGEKP
jgi:N-acetylglutamate synthase-like GNAT family acetyltransferase